ncbi:MAG: peptidylprolyl isomerase [Acidimicrobiia bacterium]|nr:peptidylprolyl isomerase [Acidimicrobiia bacterium]
MTRVLTALVLAAALAAPAAAQTPSLKNPASLNEKAPATYKVRLDTTAGPVVIQVTRDWSPNGADRFYNLVKNGFYDDVRFFRVLHGFMAQGGMHGDPAIQRLWGRNNIPDDPVKQSNKRGFVTFAKTGAPNSRSTQIFINYGDNGNLDGQGFSPFGQVTSGMEAVDKFESYGRNNVPDQGLITAEGNAYLQRDYPKLTVIKKATIEK